jgi:hypothetical protein
MGYTLDLTVEKFLHALQELVILRRRTAMANIEQESPELTILNDVILDLGEGIARYLAHAEPGRMAKEIAACHFTYDIPKVFKKEGFFAFLCPPYFSQKDLEHLQE